MKMWTFIQLVVYRIPVAGFVNAVMNLRIV